MLFPRPDTAYLWGIKAEKMTVDWGYVLCAAMHRSSIESTTSDESPWSIRRWWICPSCKKRTRIGIAQCSATRSFATALVTTEKIAMCALQWKDRCNYRCHSRRFLYSYDSYQVLARERLSMLVSDFTWKVGGMSSQFFLISQSHAMMQLFNDTCQSEYTCFYYLAADYLDRLINCDLSWLEPSRRLQWIHESSSHTSISSCDPPRPQWMCRVTFRRIVALLAKTRTWFCN